MQDEPGGAFLRNESYKHIRAVSKAPARPSQLFVMSRMLLAPAVIPVCSFSEVVAASIVIRGAGGANGRVCRPR